MSTHRENYAARILTVQRYIQQHLDEDLSLDTLATIAGWSPYHFHRLFRGMVGESTADYVRRLRLEQAAHSLRYRERSVLNIALDAGYGSHEAFTRAFTRMFGVTPTEYQSLERPPKSIQEHSMTTPAFTANDVRIEQRPDYRLACQRVVGRYNHETLGPAFGRIAQWASQHNMWRADTQSIGVYYDDPEVTPGDKQRADVAITIPADVQPPGDVQVQTLRGGLHAVLTHQGHYNTLGEAYHWLYSVWLPNSGREPADAPPYEVYLNDCTNLLPEEWLTDICIPIKA